MKNTLHTSALDNTLVEALACRTPPLSPSPEVHARIRNRLFERLHQPVDDYLFIHSHQGQWTNLLKGVDLKLLREDDTNRTFLLRMAPGSRIPPHEHALDEESIVLEGDATINGVRCHTGDYHFAPQSKPHDWITSETGCLLFIRGGIDRHAAGKHQRHSG